MSMRDVTGMTDNPATGKIAVLLPSLDGGGAERSMLNLVDALVARGRSVDLVLCRAKGPLMENIPEGVNTIELAPSGNLRSRLIVAAGNPGDFPALLRPVLMAKKNAPEVARIRSLARYMDEHRPDVLISALTYANLTAIWARQLADHAVPVIVTERNALATYCAAPHKARKWRFRYLPELVRRTYPRADAVVAVSEHVARELTSAVGHGVGLAPGSVQVIYNPVVDERLSARSEVEPQHDWLRPGGPPVVLGVGRLSEQKDFATLLRAFALLRATREARLVILGEGDLRADLEELAAQLGVADDVDMPGFVDNPFSYMARSSVLALSSRFEGLPGVLIQAMACGCPVVSSDCPGGSAEILAGGRYGALVPMADEQAMATAIAAQIDTPTSREILLKRAQDFSVDRAANTYLELIESVVSQAANQPPES